MAGTQGETGASLPQEYYYEPTTLEVLGVFVYERLAASYSAANRLFPGKLAERLIDLYSLRFRYLRFLYQMNMSKFMPPLTVAEVQEFDQNVKKPSQVLSFEEWQEHRLEHYYSVFASGTVTWPMLRQYFYWLYFVVLDAAQNTSFLLVEDNIRWLAKAFDVIQINENEDTVRRWIIRHGGWKVIANNKEIVQQQKLMAKQLAEQPKSPQREESSDDERERISPKGSVAPDIQKVTCRPSAKVYQPKRKLEEGDLKGITGYYPEMDVSPSKRKFVSSKSPSPSRSPLLGPEEIFLVKTSSHKMVSCGATQSENLSTRQSRFRSQSPQRAPSPVKICASPTLSMSPRSPTCAKEMGVGPDTEIKFKRRSVTAERASTGRECSPCSPSSSPSRSRAKGSIGFYVKSGKSNQ